MTRRLRSLAITILGLFAVRGSLFAQANPTAITSARLLDVRSGQIRTPGLIVVQNGLITQVGGTVPAGATRIDLGDATLLPGFIDAHVHLTGEIAPGFDQLPVKETDMDAVLRGVPFARRTLEAGFTTVRNLGSMGFGDVSLMNAIERGDIVGPRIIPAGHAIGVTGGHCDVTGYAPGILDQGPESGVADGADEMVAAVRYQLKHGAKVIKVCATAGVLSFEESVGAQQMSDAELRAVVEEAARHGVRVAAHAHGTQGIMAAVRAGVASIEHGSILDDEAIALMKQHGTFLVATRALAPLINMNALPPLLRRKAEHVIPIADASFRRAVAAGVRVALGTDAAVMPHGLNAREFNAMVDAGMLPIDAIRAGTLNGAELLGTTDRGELAVGKLADIVAVPGNPLQDISATSRPVMVMKGGVRVR